MSNVLNSNLIEAKEADVRTSLNTLIDSLHSYKNELTYQDRKLQEQKSLMLDRLTDSSAANVIRILTKRLEERESELAEVEQKCVELEEKSHSDECELKAKSRHIEKLSSLLLTKEEKIQELEKKFSESESKIGGFEVLVESKQEACEKWRKAAHEAAEKMRDQLNTLKASEEMNQELKSMLDKQLTKTERNISASSEVLTEEELQELVTSFSTPLTTAVTHSLGMMAPLTRTTPRYPSIDSVSSLRPSEPSSPRPTPVARSASPHLRTIIKVSRASSSPRSVSPSTHVSAAESPFPETPSSFTETLSTFPEPVVEEVVKSSLLSEEYIHVTDSNVVDASSSGVEESVELERKPTTATVRFQLDEYPDHTPGARQYAHIPYPAPLPNFSALVADALTEDRIHDPVLWKYFIRECVHFYYDLLPPTDSQARNSYFNIGRTLYERYPLIAKEGPNFKTPWTYFNTCLSSRLRNERFTKRRQNEKRGYILPVESPDSPGAKRGRIDTAGASPWREGCHL